MFTYATNDVISNRRVAVKTCN